MRIKTVVTARWFEHMVAGAIVLNAITLALETYPEIMDGYGQILRNLDIFFVTFFVAELGLRLAAYGRKLWSDHWHWFDVVIVSLSVLPLIGIAGLGNVSAFRALRLLRLMSVIPAFRHVMYGVYRALRDSVAVMGVLGLLLVIFSIIASKLYGEFDPTHFGNLHTTLFTLFQIMTLDAWSDVARPIIAVYPLAALFFCSFIVVVVFVLLSTIIGIAANAMSYTKSEEE